MEQLTKEYLDKCRDVWGLSPRTIQTRQEAFDLFFNKYKGEFTLESFEGFVSWMKGRGNSVQSIVSRGANVRLLIQYAARKGLCEDFTKEIRLPKIHFTPPVAIPLQDAERAIMLGTEIKGVENNTIQNNKIEARAAMKFALRTGLRISELMGLKPEHFRIEECSFFVVTTKSYKTVPMPLPLDMIDEIKGRMNREFIFEPSDPKVLGGYLHIGSEKAQLSIRLHMHDLRDAFCMDLFRRGVPIQTIKELMRHADYSSLAKYSAALLEDKALAINSSELVSRVLEPEEMLKLVEQNIEKTGVKNNEKLKVTVTKEAKRFVFVAEVVDDLKAVENVGEPTTGGLR